MRRKPTNGSQTYKCKDGKVGTQEGWEKKEKKKGWERGEGWEYKEEFGIEIGAGKTTGDGDRTQCS